MSPDLSQAEIDGICEPHRGGYGTPYEGSPLQRWHQARRAEEESRPFELVDSAALAREQAEWAAIVRQQAKVTRAALVRFHAGKRRSAKIRRTPSWANFEAIRAVYAEAHRLTIETGIEHHVDHDLPLQGELVSGLHVETNLQILTAAENIRKRNHFQP